MKKICVLVLLLVVASVASATDLIWIGNYAGGDGVSFTGNNNWTADWVNPHAAPGSTDTAQILAISWVSAYPTLSGSATVGSLFMGLDNTGHLPGAALTIQSSGSLSTSTGNGVQIGWYSNAVLNTAGTVNTGTAWLTMGAGNGANGYGNATLNITGGTVTTGAVNFNLNSTNHIQLDGGTLNAGDILSLHETNQSIDITGLGKIVVAGNWTGPAGWLAEMNHLTGYGLGSKIQYDYNVTTPGATTITAIPEPATMLLLGLGGLLLRKKR